MAIEDLRNELGLEVLAIRFDETAIWLEAEEIETIEVDVRNLIKVARVPEEANHAYLTVYGDGEFPAKISHYNIMYRRRQKSSPNQKEWTVDKLLGSYEGL